MKKLIHFLFGTKKRIMVFALIVFMIVAMLFITFYLIRKNSLREKLYSLAQTEMLSTLKAPSTAIFSPTFTVKKFVLHIMATTEEGSIYNSLCGGIEVPMDKEYSKYAGDDYAKYYEVSFWAEAQNSYGAMLRTDYTCIIETGDKVGCMDTEEKELTKERVCPYL
jgi:hypothetical protein